MDLFPVLLSLRVSALATLWSVAIGLPLAWVFAFRRFPGRSILDAVITLPVVLPPSVLGYYLLLLIGRRGLIGSPLEAWFGVRLVFTWHAAVIAAVIAALPLFVRSARAAFEQVDESFLGAARTLGRGELVIFFRILLPLAWRGVLAGVVLCWARALGEFGATLLVAGNIPGRTQTMAIAIYDAVQAQDTARADTLVAILTVTSVVVILTMNYLGRASVRRRHVRRNRPLPERGRS